MGYEFFDMARQSIKVSDDSGTTIMVVRHGDKDGGISLSPKGEIRAMNLAYYVMAFAAKNGHLPDHIYVAKPGETHEPSIRCMQTAGPTLNLLAQKDWDFHFRHHYHSDDWDKLVKEIKDISSKPKFILIIWEHHRIADIVAKLMGVDVSTIPQYPDNAFNRVYQIDNWGSSPTLQILDDQYPANFNGSFKDIVQSVSSSFWRSLNRIPFSRILSAGSLFSNCRTSEESKDSIPNPYYQQLPKDSTKMW